MRVFFCVYAAMFLSLRCFVSHLRPTIPFRRAGVVFVACFCCMFLLYILFVHPQVYHSTSPHKEFRFLLPVLPIAHAYAGKAVSAFILSAKTKLGRAETAPGDELAQNLQDAADDNRRKAKEPRKASAEGAGTEESEGEAVARVRSTNSSTATSCRGRQGRRRRTVVAVGLACLHAPAAVYLSVWHQSGALSAVDAVARRVSAVASAREASASAGGGGEAVVVAVHFLMPCHSAPLHSHLHFRGVETALWSLDCSPK